mgnify:CR=1 FL=1
MSFLTKAANKEDRDSPDKDSEEQYERMFMKIGRDFVHKNDLENILRQMLFILAPNFTAVTALINLTDDSEARKRALEYKQFLDDQKNGSEIYKDLINLNEDD